jgi:hypothetical protein
MQPVEKPFRFILTKEEDLNGSKLPIQVPETLSVFHPRAQRNASRHRDARPQSRLFVPRNPKLPPSPNSNRAC